MHARPRSRHVLGVAATVTALAAALSCTGTPGGGGGGQVPASPNPKYLATCPDGGMDHSGGGMDHGGGGSGGGGMDHGDMPDRLNHEPCAAQQAKAHLLISDTRAAVRAAGLDNVATIRARGYISIGDEATGVTHYVMPSYHYDQYELDPGHVEAFAYKGGRVVAAMYILSNGKTMDDVPDIAGTWTMWHNHVLPFRSNNPYTNGYYQLGGMYTRETAPMLHVWLERNPCGPFAGTDGMNMTGSCRTDIE